ncbi:trihelix transcription factor GTL1-like [Forsythia ovata]|uniref:Trihelix transcription factor GTL1-like n=1 Tax=Forsythia ovata TaxID=205694 RepID=A0ABD1XBY9_9LAMI
MENLIRQTRVRYSDAGKANREESSSSRDIKIPPQKSQAFKGENKRGQSWLRRQFSRQMSRDSDFNDDALEYPTAVAAAAFAIHSLEEPRIRDQNKTAAYGPADASSTKTSSKDQDARAPISSSTSGLKMPEKEVVPASSMKKTPTFTDAQPEKSVPQKTAEPYQSMGPTRTRSKRPESVAPKPESLVPKPDRPPPRQSTPRPVETERHFSPRPGDTMADTWEKAEMARIEEKYEKLRTRIQTWETNKKEKARRRLEKIENELSEKKRAKGMERYWSDIERIEKISAGAREQAKDNRRNEEFKAKAKANKIRATGKLPPTCLCF